MQTSFDAPKLNIQCNHCIPKKLALNTFHATHKYKSMSSAEREQTDSRVIVDCEIRQNADLKQQHGNGSILSGFPMIRVKIRVTMRAMMTATSRAML